MYQGCLKPVQVRIPRGCLLDPSDTAAVVGGNVLTSQRVVDVILLAFGVCAASQGCTNNITFGDEQVIIRHSYMCIHGSDRLHASRSSSFELRQTRNRCVQVVVCSLWCVRSAITKQWLVVPERARRGTAAVVYTRT